MMAGLYWERGLQLPQATECELVELDAQLIPALLSALAGRMGRSHWETDAAWLEGYSRLSRQGAELLMGCKEYLIVEIRSARDATPTHEPYDLAIYPAGMYPGASMAHLVNQQTDAGLSTAQLLTQIRDTLAASGEGSAEQLELLGQMVLLLGGV
jgi:hypothetical protein